MLGPDTTIERSSIPGLCNYSDSDSDDDKQSDSKGQHGHPVPPPPSEPNRSFSTELTSAVSIQKPGRPLVSILKTSKGKKSFWKNNTSKSNAENPPVHGCLTEKDAASLQQQYSNFVSAGYQSAPVTKEIPKVTNPFASRVTTASCNAVASSSGLQACLLAADDANSAVDGSTMSNDIAVDKAVSSDDVVSSTTEGDNSEVTSCDKLVWLCSKETVPKSKLIPLNKGCQTDAALLESKVFKSCSTDMNAFKQIHGYKCVDELASVELETEHGWLDLLVQQLRVRDSVIAELNKRADEFRHSGITLEMDADYLQLKIACLESEVQKLRSQLRRKRKTRSQDTQTEEFLNTKCPSDDISEDVPPSHVQEDVTAELSLTDASIAERHVVVEQHAASEQDSVQVHHLTVEPQVLANLNVDPDVPVSLATDLKSSWEEKTYLISDNISPGVVFGEENNHTVPLHLILPPTAPPLPHGTIPMPNGTSLLPITIEPKSRVNSPDTLEVREKTNDLLTAKTDSSADDEHESKRKRTDSSSSTESVKMLPTPAKIPKVIETVTLDDIDDSKQTKDLLSEVLIGSGSKPHISVEELLKKKKIELLKLHEKEEAKKLEKLRKENERKAQREREIEQRKFKSHKHSRKDESSGRIRSKGSLKSRSSRKKSRSRSSCSKSPKSQCRKRSNTCSPLSRSPKSSFVSRRSSRSTSTSSRSQKLKSRKRSSSDRSLEIDRDCEKNKKSHKKKGKKEKHKKKPKENTGKKNSLESSRKSKSKHKKEKKHKRSKSKDVTVQADKEEDIDTVNKVSASSSTSSIDTSQATMEYQEVDSHNVGVAAVVPPCSKLNLKMSQNIVSINSFDSFSSERSVDEKCKKERESYTEHEIFRNEPTEQECIESAGAKLESALASNRETSSEDSSAAGSSEAINVIQSEIISAVGTEAPNSNFEYLKDFQLYYDKNTGYYFDSNTSVYYNSVSGHFYYFDSSTQQYQYYQKVQPDLAKPFAVLLVALQHHYGPSSTNNTDNSMISRVDSADTYGVAVKGHTESDHDLHSDRTVYGKEQLKDTPDTLPVTPDTLPVTPDTLPVTSRSDEEDFSRVKLKAINRTQTSRKDKNELKQLASADICSKHVCEKRKDNVVETKNVQKEAHECSSGQETHKMLTSEIASDDEVMDSVSYEEELRRRLTSRLLERSTVKETSTVQAPAVMNHSCEAESAQSGASSRSSSADNTPPQLCEDEEEKRFHEDYAAYRQRKELLLQTGDSAPSLRLMLVGVAPVGSVESAPSVHTNPLTAPVLPKLITGRRSKRLEVLYVVTKDGGVVGRLSRSDVYLPHISVSKEHARITYSSSGDGDHHYHVQDLGSNNGTYVNGTRLSASKKLSNPIELGHGWLLTVGEVQFQVHLHPGALTCNTCEPGLVSCCQDEEVLCSSRDESREVRRRQTNNALRRKFGLGREGGDNSSSDPVLSRASLLGYSDRASNRRQTVGSDNPYEKTQVASALESLSSSSKGFKMLQKMGWAEGSSLGKTSHGRTEPVAIEKRPDGVGLGAESLLVEVTPDARSKRLEAARRRYQELR